MAVTVQKYDVVGLVMGKCDLTVETSTSGTYVALMNSSHPGVIAATSDNSIFGEISANTHDGVGSGYFQHNPGGGTPTGGALLSSITLTESAGLATFDAGDVEWTASGATIPSSANATAAVIVNYGFSAAGMLMFNIDFGADEQAGDGTAFKITWNGSGIYTLDSNP